MTMNIFRLCGDMCRFYGTLLVLKRVAYNQNAMGISIKTQYLVLLLHLSRYLDIVLTFFSVYNFNMKLYFISSSLIIVYMMKFHTKVKITNDTPRDTFPYIKYLILPCVTISVIQHYADAGQDDWSLLEFFWTLRIKWIKPCKQGI